MMLGFLLIISFIIITFIIPKIVKRIIWLRQLIFVLLLVKIQSFKNFIKRVVTFSWIDLLLLLLFFIITVILPSWIPSRQVFSIYCIVTLIILLLLLLLIIRIETRPVLIGLRLLLLLWDIFFQIFFYNASRSFLFNYFVLFLHLLNF